VLAAVSPRVEGADTEVPAAGGPRVEGADTEVPAARGPRVEEADTETQAVLTSNPFGFESVEGPTNKKTPP
ncbi:MAG: hypothetical protein V3R58_02980, partial [candidate division NC10 bacterium]